MANRILIAGNAEYGSLAVVRALQAAGYTPWLAADKPRTYAARSRVTAGTVSVHDPELDSERFVREVAAAAARLSVVAVLPGGESYLLALAGRDADFAGVALGAPSRENVERATDKELLTKLSAAAGLRTPPTAKVTSDDSAAIGTFGFLAIVKPRRNWIQDSGEHGLSAHSMSYHKVSCVSSDEEARRALKTLPGGEGLVQEYIPGQLISVVGVSWGGRTLLRVASSSDPDLAAAMWRKRLRGNNTAGLEARAGHRPLAAGYQLEWSVPGTVRPQPGWRALPDRSQPAHLRHARARGRRRSGPAGHLG